MTNSLYALQVEAERHQRENNWGEEAIAINSQLIEFYSRDVDSYLRRAKCYEHMERFGAATVDYKSVLMLDQYHPRALDGIKRIKEHLAGK